MVIEMKNIQDKNFTPDCNLLYLKKFHEIIVKFENLDHLCENSYDRKWYNLILNLNNFQESTNEGDSFRIFTIARCFEVERKERHQFFMGKDFRR